LEAELVRSGIVQSRISARPFKDLPKVYEEMETGEIAGRIVLRVSDE